MGVGAQRDAECAGESKVGELEVALAVDEEVLGFEIAMQDAVGVQVVDALDELPGECLNWLVSGRRAR